MNNEFTPERTLNTFHGIICMKRPRYLVQNNQGWQAIVLYITPFHKKNRIPTVFYTNEFLPVSNFKEIGKLKSFVKSWHACLTFQSYGEISAKFPRLLTYESSK